MDNLTFVVGQHVSFEYNGKAREGIVVEVKETVKEGFPYVKVDCEGIVKSFTIAKIGK